MCDKINKYKNKQLLPLVYTERKPKGTGQYTVQESIYAAVVNDDRILERLVPVIFLFHEKALYEVKPSGLQLSLNIF